MSAKVETLTNNGVSRPTSGVQLRRVAPSAAMTSWTKSVETTGFCGFFVAILPESDECAIKMLSVMATVIVRNLSQKVVKSLKSIARKNHRSMEQEVRELLERHVGDRVSALRQIEEAWGAQSRRTTAEEIETWIVEGRN